MVCDLISLFAPFSSVCLKTLSQQHDVLRFLAKRYKVIHLHLGLQLQHRKTRQTIIKHQIFQLLHKSLGNHSHTSIEVSHHALIRSQKSHFADLITQLQLSCLLPEDEVPRRVAKLKVVQEIDPLLDLFCLALEKLRQGVS